MCYEQVFNMFLWTSAIFVAVLVTRSMAASDCQKQSWMVGPCVPLGLGNISAPTIANDRRDGNLAVGGNLFSIYQPTDAAPFFVLTLIPVRGVCVGSLTLTKPSQWPRGFSIKYNVTTADTQGIVLTNIAGSGGPPAESLKEKKLTTTGPTATNATTWTATVYMPFQTQIPAGQPCEFQLQATSLRRPSTFPPSGDTVHLQVVQSFSSTNSYIHNYFHYTPVVIFVFLSHVNHNICRSTSQTMPTLQL